MWRTLMNLALVGGALLAFYQMFSGTFEWDDIYTRIIVVIAFVRMGFDGLAGLFRSFEA